MNVAVITPGEDSVSPSATPPGASSSAETPDETESVIVRRPANGLTVLMRENHELPYATVQIYTRGGLLLEKEGEEGLAAMTGSLLTAGTRRYSKMEMAEKIENVGGSLNSGCGNNTCFVSSKVLREDLESALELVSSALLEPVFPEEEIEKKRKETLLAIERQDEDWQAELMRLFRSHFFGSHPYGHNPLGTEASVKRFTREDIMAFHARMARPERTVVAVYGDFRAGEVMKTVEKLFGKWRAGAAGEPTRPGPVPPLTEDRVIVKENEKTSAGLFVGTNGLSLNDPRRPALDVLDALISGIGYPGGRLHEALRGGEADLVYVVHAFPFLGIDTGFFGVLTQTTLENLESVEAIVLDNLKRVAEEPVSNEELQTAKEMVVTMHYLSLESLEAQAQSAAVNEVLRLGWDYDRRYPDMVRSVTADDILSLARELFTNTLIVKTLPVRMSRLQPRTAWISASSRWMFCRAKSMEGSSSRAMR
jgi:zinc protease